MQRINSAGLALLKRFESCRLSAYLDAVGVWTIGWGHTANVYPGQHITQEQADELLLKDLDHFETGVSCQVMPTLTSNQFSACVCLAYNIGLGNFHDSTVRARLNAGRIKEASVWFLPWHKGRDPKTGKLVEIEGLLVRRLAEMRLYDTPDG
jgi:lysozyme